MIREVLSPILVIMRKRLILLFSTLTMWLSSLFAQDIPAEVLTAFKKGESEELNAYLGSKLELIIGDKPPVADKATAQKMLAAFFKENKVLQFNINHRGQRNESSFIVGTLQTANATFRVNCFLRKQQNNHVIHQIRIDKTDE